jgi:hypothetical protein
MFPYWPKAMPNRYCLALALLLGLPPSTEAKAPPKAATDPFLVAMLGALPLMSGYYLTTTPQKGAAFTLADAVLIGSIVRIRSDRNIPPEDAAVYYGLLGAVNVADMALSLLQARSDAEPRFSVTVNPQDLAGIRLAWRF